MLVSPIMGPVLALTFGSLIHDLKLTWLGLKHELASLLICLGIGFVIGLISIGIGTDGEWPSSEMRSRGVLNSLAIGFAVAIFSGVGVALSVLGNNNASLIGVAISASLLPPAVNCGIAFAYALCGFPLDSGALDDDGNQFSDGDSYFKLGGVSLCLTLINIGAIYLSASIMFRVKEVAPISNETAFWQEDIKLSRGWNFHGTSPSASAGSSGLAGVLSAVSNGPVEGNAASSAAPTDTDTGSAPPAPVGLELQNFERNPILQEEFLRSSIGQTVMTADNRMLVVGTSTSTTPSPRGGASPSSRQRLVNILRQDSFSSTGSVEQEVTSGDASRGPQESPSPKKHTAASDISSVAPSPSSPTVSEYNTATPGSFSPQSFRGRRTLRRGSKSAHAIVVDQHDAFSGSGESINLDEIKERLRFDAMLLSSSSAASPLFPSSPHDCSDKSKEV